MTVLRWAVGVVAALLAIGTVFAFGVSVAFENDVWRQRTRRLRAWLWVLALAWFNGEVWGRVLYTVVHWAG